MSDDSLEEKLEKNFVKKAFFNLDKVVCPNKDCIIRGSYFKCYDLKYEKCAIYNTK